MQCLMNWRHVFLGFFLYVRVFMGSFVISLATTTRMKGYNINSNGANNTV